MKKKMENFNKATILRQKAEKRLERQKKEKPFTHEADMLKMVHELEVHQIELKIQNDELQKAIEKAEIERERVEEQSNKYQTLFNSIRDAILVADTERNIIDCNAAFCELFGYSKADIIGKKTRYVYEDEAQFKELGQAIKTNYKENNPFIYTVNYKKKNHEIFPGETGVYYLKNNAGAVLGFIGLIRDITERRKAEIALNNAKIHAEESDHLKSAFLANMSHEIRTPMNGILGFTSLLEKAHLSDETRDQYIQIIKKSGDRMLNTVNDLISISKIETGQVEVKREVCNLSALVKNHIDFFNPSAMEKGLTLNLEQSCACQDERIMIDVSKFDSIITNLIRNAIKFTDVGSINVKCNKDDTRFTLEVCDTGEGIPKDRQEAIFERFIQADIDDSRALEGSGLGLSIVKAYVDMLGGTIVLESEPGKGSCFTVELPIIKADKKIISYEHPSDSLSEKTFKKILIVEDDEISYLHLSISLEDHSDILLHALNGKEAIKLTKEHDDIDLILMDIKMPGMDGYEATKAIREFNKDVMIVAQTAYALPEDKQKAKAAGCSAYISKPIVIDALLKLVSK